MIRHATLTHIIVVAMLVTGTAAQPARARMPVVLGKVVVLMRHGEIAEVLPLQQAEGFPQTQVGWSAAAAMLRHLGALHAALLDAFTQGKGKTARRPDAGDGTQRVLVDGFAVEAAHHRRA